MKRTTMSVILVVAATVNFATLQSSVAATLTIPTTEGTLVVELHDNDVKVSVLKNLSGVEIIGRDQDTPTIVEVVAQKHRLSIRQGKTAFEAPEVSVATSWSAKLVAGESNRAPGPAERETETNKPLTFKHWNYPADENGVAGFFHQNDDSSWTEMKGDKSWATFKEATRTPDYVELFDEGRNLHVRLTPNQMSWSPDGKQFSEMYQGAAAEPNTKAAAK